MFCDDSIHPVCSDFHAEAMSICHFLLYSPLGRMEYLCRAIDWALLANSRNKYLARRQVACYLMMMMVVMMLPGGEMKGSPSLEVPKVDDMV